MVCENRPGLWKSLWQDESGAILSAEAVLLGSVVVAGATVGLSAAGKAVNDELTDVALAIRSLDQSYAVRGYSTPYASVAGSSFIQQPVEESREELRAFIAEQEAQAEAELQRIREEESEAPAPENAREHMERAREEALRRFEEARERIQEQARQQREQFERMRRERQEQQGAPDQNE